MKKMNLKLAPNFYRHHNLVEEWRYYTIENVHESIKICLSTKGRVMRMHEKDGSEEFLKPGNINGYPTINIKLQSGKYVNRYLHKILAQVFFKKPEDAKFVIHKNYDKKDNHIQNLAWATKLEYEAHQDKNPKVIKSRKELSRPFTKLSFAEAKVLKKKLLDPNRRTRLRILAKQFGVSEMQLHRIKTGENWGDLKV